MNRITIDEACCCGCGACADVCPRDAIILQANPDGFLMPVLDERKCISCGLCAAVCQFQKEKQTEPGIQAAYALKCHDRETVMKSSSGGAFTAISDCVLASGGVIAGAVMEPDFTVRHVIAGDAAGRDAMRGSKYVQSDTQGIFREVKTRLSGGQLVMFVGTPCQAAAMRAYLRGDDENLLLVDFLCHGVPCNAMFREHIQALEKHYGRRVTGYSFRGKHLGWDPAHTECAQLEGSEKYVCHEAMQGFTRLFNASLSLREGCFNCPYRSHYRFADLTIADFWGIEQIMGKADKTGVSLVAVGSDKGAAWLKQAEQHAEVSAVPVEKILHRFPLKPVRRKPSVDAFRAFYRAHGYEAAMRKYSATGTMKSRLRFMMKKIKRKVFDVER